MDLNELRGKVIRVNLARPMKTPIQGMANNKASKLLASTLSMIFTHSTCPIQYGNQKNGLSNMRNHLLKVEVSYGTFCYPLIYQQARLQGLHSGLRHGATQHRQRAKVKVTMKALRT